jgi:serine/threonine protein kinase
MSVISVKKDYPELLKNTLIERSIIKSEYKKIINKFGYNDISKAIVLEELSNHIKTNILKIDNISKYLLNDILNKTISKETKAIYRTFRFREIDYILIPFLISSNDIFLNFNDIYISDTNTQNGAYSTIYLSLSNKVNNKLIPLDFVFKITLIHIKNKNTSLYDEFIANIINYYLCKVTKQSKSIVKITEFGMVKKPYRGVYSILEKCNFDLNYYIKYKNIDYLKDFKKLIKFMVNILSGVKYLHDIKYLHLDIKLPNYLIKIENKNLLIKLTDFGFAKRIGDKNILPGTLFYADPRIVLNNNLKQLTGDRMMDIFSLGIIFLEIVIKLTNNNYFYVCPLLKNNEYNKLFMREKYYENTYKNNNFESDAIKIKKIYSNINKSNTNISEQLCDINLKMICDTRHRYKNIDSIILDLMKIKNELNYKNNNNKKTTEK